MSPVLSRRSIETEKRGRHFHDTVGNTDDWCRVDAEVGDEDWGVDSESDSEV
jgi:hypothetical protein